MTIDPMAAVTSATSSTGSDAAGKAAATSQTSTATQQAGAAEQGARVDLFDYAAEHQNRPPAIDTLQPEGKAKYLSNPAVLGEKVLQRMETLHQRSLDYHNQLNSGQLQSGQATTTTEGSSNVMAGPAGTHVAGSAKASETTGADYAGLKQMFDYATETKMVSMASSQFVSAVNTLMKGQ